MVGGAVFGFQLGTWFSVAMIGFAGAAVLYDTSNIIQLLSRRPLRVGGDAAVCVDRADVLVRAAPADGQPQLTDALAAGPDPDMPALTLQSRCHSGHVAAQGGRHGDGAVRVLIVLQDRHQRRGRPPPPTRSGCAPVRACRCRDCAIAPACGAPERTRNCCRMKSRDNVAATAATPRDRRSWRCRSPTSPAHRAITR